MSKNYIMQAWLVLTLAVVFAAVLAGLEITLKPQIEQNKLDETYSQIPNLVAGADKNSTAECFSADGKIAYKALASDGRHLGWVIRASGQGFADKIELLIGMDAKADRILGLYVLDQKETPAVGNKIVEAKWRQQFSNRDATKPLKISKTKQATEANGITPVTGATVSSRSVCEIVNKAVMEFRQALPSLKEKQQDHKNGQ